MSYPIIFYTIFHQTFLREISITKEFSLLLLFYIWTHCEYKINLLNASEVRGSLYFKMRGSAVLSVDAHHFLSVPVADITKPLHCTSPMSFVMIPWLISLTSQVAVRFQSKRKQILSLERFILKGRIFGMWSDSSLPVYNY